MNAIARQIAGTLIALRHDSLKSARELIKLAKKLKAQEQSGKLTTLAAYSSSHAERIQARLRAMRMTHIALVETDPSPKLNTDQAIEVEINAAISREHRYRRIADEARSINDYNTAHVSELNAAECEDLAAWLRSVREVREAERAHG